MILRKCTVCVTDKVEAEVQQAIPEEEEERAKDGKGFFLFYDYYIKILNV